MWSWLEVAGKTLYELRWPLLLYFGGLLVCYQIIVSVQYWVREWRTRRAEARFRRMGLGDIDGMEPRTFRQYLSFLFHCAGFGVRPTPPSGNFGVDLVLIHPASEERIAVQARRGPEPVEERAVLEVTSARALYQCTRAMIVTTGDFTPEARERAEAAGVTLVDRTKLQEFIALTLGSVPLPEQEPVPEPQSAVGNG